VGLEGCFQKYACESRTAVGDVHKLVCTEARRVEKRLLRPVLRNALRETRRKRGYEGMLEDRKCSRRNWTAAAELERTWRGLTPDHAVTFPLEVTTWADQGRHRSSTSVNLAKGLATEEVLIPHI
jgi:hypothetical protein